WSSDVCSSDLTLPENVFHILPDSFFTDREVRHCGVCGVGEQAQDTLFAEAGHLSDVGGCTDRGEVELEVARMDDIAFRCLYHDTVCFRYGMGRAVEFHGHMFEFQHRIFLYWVELCSSQEVVLLQFIADESQCERPGVYRYVDFLEKEWYAADMILVAVGDDQCADALLVLF